MDNSSKALYMAGSLLIALLIISLLVYAFNNIGGIQDEKDKQEYGKSITDFNKEYEVFNKKLMLGTDVISCLNKAINNNEKYVKTGKWAEGYASGEEAIIKIDINLKSDIYETLQLYDEKGHALQTVGNSDNDKAIYNSLKDQTINDLFGKKCPSLTKINNLNQIINRNIFGSNGYCFIKYNLSNEVLQEDTTYKLLNEDDTNYENNEIVKLTKNSNDMEYYAYSKRRR